MGKVSRDKAEADIYMHQSVSSELRNIYSEYSLRLLFSPWGLPIITRT